MEYFLQRLNHLNGKLRSFDLLRIPEAFWQKNLQFLKAIRAIGANATLDEYEKRKLGIFNQLNFFQLITGILVPAVSLIYTTKFPQQAWIVASLPAFISLLVLVLNAHHKYEAALLSYFIFYPVFTCVIYINGLSLGIELSFILYGILSVFFLQEIGYMLFSVGLSMVSYFMLSISWKDYPYQLELINPAAYIFNHVLGIIYIFYGLYLVKRDTAHYQFSILSKNRRLHKSNIEIEKQKKEISEKAILLEKQAAALHELNGVKNKLFSIISHDLKAPLYAIRNLFRHAQRSDLSADEIKEMIPDVINDLDSTTTLMENLLQWAKCQMQSNAIRPQKLNISDLVNQVSQLLHLQIEAKQIQLEKKTELPAYTWADKDMVNLILRNLLSNAIKFTPSGGRIVIGTYESSSCVEVYVQDSGRGISKEEMKKINKNNFYSTNGTNSEGGTGLGLMLCREFLSKNEGRMMIESQPGQGSTFSFTLPLASDYYPSKIKAK